MVHNRHILLADDDKDDSIVFREILEEPLLATHLAIVYSGEELMKLLHEQKGPLPDTLFLDLNMPRKNGFECLKEIKQTDKLKQLPVIIFSTSYESDAMSLLYNYGAQYYIRKPNDFTQFKKVISQPLTLTEQTGISQPPREKFVLSEQSIKQ